MTTIDWIALLLGALAALGLAWFTYARREPAGRGRTLLTALRAATLILLILLLIDPQLTDGAGTRRRSTRVVLDASLSMMPRAADSLTWQRAIRTAREQGSAPVVLTGAEPRVMAADSLGSLRPEESRSRALPALQAAAEAGAQRVVLVTDGALEDIAEVARWMPRLGVELDIKNIEAPVIANRAIAELVAPAWAEAGQPLTLRVGVAARGGSNAASLVVRQNGNIVVQMPVQLPADGRVASAELQFTANGPAAGGLVRYDVAFAEIDSIPDDDVRSAYVFISEKPAGVAIVSFLPDWEPKFLHPVLADALGLPVRTFLRVPNGSYLRAGDGLDAGTRVTEDAVRRATAQAELVVLHGVSEQAPAWWREVAGRSRRVLIFPADAIREPMVVGAGIDADWYVAPDVPPTPVAALLQEVQVGELPPLQTLFTTPPTELAWSPLLVGRTRRGGRSPVLLAQQQGARRVAVATGTGYWRWAFRGGAPRDVYTRLWGAMAGWLVQDNAQIAGAAIRPAARSNERGQHIAWLAPGVAADSMHVRVIDQAGQVVQQSTVTQQRGDSSHTAPLPPGHYQYAARAFASHAEVAAASGPFTVESYSAEFMRAPADLRALRSAPSTLGETRRASGTPLHASPFPYLGLVLLLCAEWILRRRWGLR